MENASKALLMAAEVMVGVLILGLFATLFFTFSNYQKTTQSELDRKIVSEYNAQFEQYICNDLTPQGVLSLVNLVKNINKQNDGGVTTITILYGSGINASQIKNAETFLNPSTSTLYKATVTKRDKDGKITQIQIRK